MGREKVGKGEQWEDVAKARAGGLDKANAGFDV